MYGYFLFAREIFDKAVWTCSTPEQKTVLTSLMGMVNFKRNEWAWQGELFICEPGQVITSIESIMKQAGKGISIQNVRSALTKFEKLGFITDESTKQGRLITIVDWGFYQDGGNYDNSRVNERLTKEQPFNNNQLTAKKESNNDINKEKEGNVLSFPSNPLGIVLKELSELAQLNGTSINQQWINDNYNEFKSFADDRGMNEETLKKGVNWFLKNDYWKPKLVRINPIIKNWSQFERDKPKKKKQSNNEPSCSRLELLMNAKQIRCIYPPNTVYNVNELEFGDLLYCNQRSGFKDKIGEIFDVSEYMPV